MITIIIWWTELMIKLLIAFVALVHAKHLHDEGTVFTTFWKLIFGGLFIVFIIGDVFWNFTYGTVTNLELPKVKEKEWTFTKRCERHKAESSGWKRTHAAWWCRQLNQIEPGHCHDAT